MEFTCYIEIKHPKATDEDLGGCVLDRIEKHGVLIGAVADQDLNEGTIGIRFNVESPAANRAVEIGLHELCHAIGIKRLPRHSVVALEAEEYIDPDQRELVSQAEIARRLGISRERVGQLRRRDDFPKPAQRQEGPRGMLWRWGAVEGWHRKRDIRVGRPPNSAARQRHNVAA